jgi:hypothetical protein
MSENKEIIKAERTVLNIHSGAIAIENKVSLISRKAWFFMVYKAFPNLLKQEKFAVSLTELKEAIGYNSRNNKYLKEALTELVNTSVEWNILKKDKSTDWEVNSMLAGCKIPENSGICEFAFSPFLKDKLVNPEMYIKLDLLISKRFKSKYTLAVYCFSLDYLQIKFNYGSKILSIEELRSLMGLKEDEYSRVVDINKEILKRAEKEINECTDIDISIEPIRTSNRKITSFKFEMRIKEKYLNIHRSKKVISEFIEDNKISAKLDEKSSRIPKKDLIIINDPFLSKFFARYNISFTTDTFQEKLKEAQELFGADNLENYLVYLSKYAENEYKKGTIKSFAGFFVSLFKDDTQINNYLHEIEQEQRKLETNRIKVESLLDSKVKEKYENAMSNDFEEFLVNNIESLESKFIEIVNNNVTTGFAREYFINGQNKGIVDKTLILNHKRHIRLPLMSELKKFQKEFGYKKPTFEDWKLKTINSDYLNQLRLEIEQSLK